MGFSVALVKRVKAAVHLTSHTAAELALVEEWTRRYRDRLEQASADVQWQDRDSLLFWRGSDTGCLLPGAEISCARSCSEWNSTTWPLFPRSKLVLASSVFPGRIDAVFTKDTVHRECQDVYDSSGLRVGEIVPPEAHVLHKSLSALLQDSFYLLGGPLASPIFSL